MSGGTTACVEASVLESASASGGVVESPHAKRSPAATTHDQAARAPISVDHTHAYDVASASLFVWTARSGTALLASSRARGCCPGRGRGSLRGSAEIHTAGSSTLLQPQVYDRHWDSTLNDGAIALGDIYRRSRGAAANSRFYDLAWLPQHVNFGKYEVATGADLLRDGVHATDEVQAGIAAMSHRTGLHVPDLPVNRISIH